MNFPWFGRKARSLANSGTSEAPSIEQGDRQRRADFRRVELERCIDRPVIVVPNEWANPVVGFGKSLMSIGSSQVLVIHNYLSMDEVVCGGVRMDFSMQRLEIALALDPYQLWAITAHNSVGHQDYDKPKSGERWSKERIMQTLEDNGFFARWEVFKTQTQNQDAGLN